MTERRLERAASFVVGAPFSNDALDDVLRRVAGFAGVVAIAVAAVGFSGWLGPREWLVFLSAGAARVPISPNTALCQAALGGALVVRARWPAVPRARALARLLSGLVVVVATLTIVDNLAGHALAIDHWLVRPTGLACPRGDGHMSPITAAVLWLQAVALLFSMAGRVVVPAAVGWFALVSGWTTVTGYVADAPLFYGGPPIPVALLTGAGYGLTGLALVGLAGSRTWPLRLLAGDSSRAVLLRLGVPWLVLVLVAFEVAIALAFRQSGPLRAYTFAGVLLGATLIDLVLMVWVGGVIGATIDRLRAEQHRLAERLRYRKKLEAIGTFASGAAHEINNPLQQIMSCAELIADAEPGDPHIPLHARSILEASHRAGTVTHRLLAHASVDSTSPAPVRLVDLVTQTLSLAAQSLERSGVRVSVSVPVDLPPVPCRRGQLSQALLALLVNAREALDARFPGAHPDKTLDVRAVPVRLDGVDGVRVTIADRGCGIPAEHLERVFEPFFSTKARDQGAGLGLWVADAVVRELGGQVEVESTEGEGSRVTLWLPVGVVEGRGSGAPAAPGANVTEAAGLPTVPGRAG
jgi:signal transduction histidine kinase